MNLVRSLSVAAIILGIYIILSLFLSSKKADRSFPSFTKREDFHIGCYLAQHSVSHYDELTLKISRLESDAWKRQQQSRSIIPDDYIDKKGVQVATNFQRYIQDFNKFKSRSKGDLEYYQAIAKSKQDFQNCVDNLGRFSQAICLEDWNSFSKCSTDLKNLKSDLVLKISNKQKIVLQIKSLINSAASPGTQKPSHSDKFEKQFRRQDKQLENDERRIENIVKTGQQKTSKSEYYYHVAKNKTIHAQKLYSQCADHRMEFRLCQEITRQLQSLGFGSMESLEAKVQRKRTALLKMKQLKQSGSIPELDTLYQNHLDEFMKLYQLFYNTKLKIMKHCGCAQSEEARLKENLDSALKSEKEKYRQYILSREHLDQNLKQLNDIKAKRNQLQKKLQSELKKLSEPNNLDQNKIELLNKLNRQNMGYELQIQSMKDQFNGLQSRCNGYRNKLSMHISKISDIKDCLTKYQYYSQIKGRLDKQSSKPVAMNEVIKRTLKKSVEEFVI